MKIVSKIDKNNIGHLPTSEMPGEEGLCIIMGHRDTQFSILKHCEIGDRIILKTKNKIFVYTVYSIKIIDNDSSLLFETVNGECMALITCYPFQYTGRAPQKYILYARLNNNNIKKHIG